MSRTNNDQYNDAIFKDIHTAPIPQLKNGASLLTSVIKNFSLKPGSGMNSVQCPPSILKKMSVLEMYALLASPRSYLLQDWSALSPLDRFLNAFRWFLEQQMYYPQQGLQDVKPYNPILGEIFKCSWNHANSTTTAIAEQISHHPPISALYVENKKWGFYFQQTIQPLTTFWGTKTITTLEADNTLRLVGLDEEYVSKDPQAVMRNLLFGTSVLEHSDKMFVECKKTGFYAELKFPTKSKWSVKGTVFQKSTVEGENPTQLFRVEGSMHDTVELVDLKTNERRVFAQFKDSPRHPEFEMQVKPVAEQEENESRRVWYHLTKNLVERDLVAASEAKTVVEEHERALRKKRPSDWKWETHHEARFFTNSGEKVGPHDTTKWLYKARMSETEASNDYEDDGDLD